MNTPAWLNELLQRKDVTDICLNGPSEAFIDIGSGLEPFSIPQQAALWNQNELKTWVLDKLSQTGKSWDARHPFIDATISTGHRLHVSFPPTSQKGILISLRRLPSPSTPSNQSAAERFIRWGNSPFYLQLAQMVRQGDSVLIAGATGSGKTTLANDLLGEVSPNERILALEDTPELTPSHPHFLSLTSRPPNADGYGEVTLRALLRQCLRMRPDRIVLGECRGDEVLELLQAINTGHRGALATLHANSPRDALRRVELLCLLASKGSIPLSTIRELLAVGVQWIAQVHRNGPVRGISELWHVEGREGDTILLRPVIRPV
jgi:pilus assembly protein CpaF